MERSSRFQNPVPLSSVGVSKPPPIQSDGAGMKPLPPLLLDRFRAMVKDREEELRVFGDAAALPLETEEIVQLYEIILSELTVNSKPMITDLTVLAEEQRAHGEAIAGAICSRIIEVLGYDSSGSSCNFSLQFSNSSPVYCSCCKWNRSAEILIHLDVSSPFYLFFLFLLLEIFVPIIILSP